MQKYKSGLWSPLNIPGLFCGKKQVCFQVVRKNLLEFKFVVSNCGVKKTKDLKLKENNLLLGCTFSVV